MSQIAEEFTFVVLSVTRFENSVCSCDFIDEFQETKVCSGW